MRVKRSELTIQKPRSRTVYYDGPLRVPGMFIHMFDEDVELNVMPIGGRRHQKKFTVIFEGAEDECARALRLFELLSRERYGGAEEILSRAFRNISSQLLEYCVAHFEILRAESDNRRDYFVLHPIQSNLLYRVPFGYIQWIPKTLHTMPERIYLPGNTVWRLQMPLSLGGRFGHRRLRASLSRMTGFPTFQEQALKRGQLKTDFDFSEFSRIDRAGLLFTTRRWGWNGRNTSLDFETEFYVVTRYIRFKWATATLREHIVKQFNQLLRSLGISASLRLEGVITATEALAISDLLSAGQIGIAEAYKRVNLEID